MSAPAASTSAHTPRPDGPAPDAAPQVRADPYAELAQWSFAAGVVVGLGAALIVFVAAIVIGGLP